MSTQNGKKRQRCSDSTAAVGKRFFPSDYSYFFNTYNYYLWEDLYVSYPLELPHYCTCRRLAHLDVRIEVKVPLTGYFIGLPLLFLIHTITSLFMCWDIAWSSSLLS
jgi:hypothetical protein